MLLFFLVIGTKKLPWRVSIKLTNNIIMKRVYLLSLLVEKVFTMRPINVLTCNFLSHLKGQY